MTNAQIWVLYDGKAGHLSQSQGLAQRLANRTGAEVRTIKAYPRSGLLRLLAVWLCRLGMISPRLLLSFYRCELPQGMPQQILSFGGKIVPLNVALASLYHCDNILIGNRYGIPARLFSVLVTARDEGLPNQVATRVPFSCAGQGKSADDVRRADYLRSASRPLWLLLIGGEGSGFCYQDQDWQRLKAAMIDLAEKYDIRWLVSNSRRTPAAGTALLSDAELRAYCHDVIDYQESRAGLGAYLKGAERIFVTADSLSMLTEAVAQNRALPVVGLRPEKVTLKDGVHRQTLQHYVDANWLQFCDIAAMAQFVPARPEILATYDQVLEAATSQVVAGLSRPPKAALEYLPRSY
ncbi:ELM1/GtrOC1 family putative glycosyltransferase [Marinobacterium lutimaris]|uniref:Nucleoside-diphosphate sugar epimerase n=1 Tax=Marinobacterium lutimaris TaxID=568106 RepID=A0A1H5XJ78_9GAMM|nr:ELM1/GtrOC1 family putative glycosyltransferase [Marinobacterium lutimaris]SEG11811.1 hypothetical protein SAMN05444390_1011407 [Marinobacterium lutimaris]